MVTARFLLPILLLISGARIGAMESSADTIKDLRARLTALYLQGKFFKRMQHYVANNETERQVCQRNLELREQTSSTARHEFILDKQRSKEMDDFIRDFNLSDGTKEEAHAFINEMLPTLQANPQTKDSSFSYVLALDFRNKSTESYVYMLQNIKLITKQLYSQEDVAAIEAGLQSDDPDTKHYAHLFYISHLETIIGNKQKPVAKKAVDGYQRLANFSSSYQLPPVIAQKLSFAQTAAGVYRDYVVKLQQHRSAGTLKPNQPEDFEFIATMKKHLNAYRSKAPELDELYKQYMNYMTTLLKRDRSLYKLDPKKQIDKPEKNLPDSLIKYHEPQDLITFDKLFSESRYKDPAQEVSQSFLPAQAQVEVKKPAKKSSPKKKKKQKKKPAKPQKEMPRVNEVAPHQVTTTNAGQSSEPKKIEIPLPEGLVEKQAYYEFTDAESGVTYLFYKVANEPLALPVFNYDRRVEEWFDDPRHALHTQGYFDPNSRNYTPEDRHFSAIARHRFPRAIDAFIQKLGIKMSNSSHRNKPHDLSIGIPGEIILGSQRMHVIYTYGINTAENCCYHRCATTRTIDEIMAYAQEGRYEVDFPPLIP